MFRLAYQFLEPKVFDNLGDAQLWEKWTAVTLKKLGYFFEQRLREETEEIIAKPHFINASEYSLDYGTFSVSVTASIGEKPQLQISVTKQELTDVQLEQALQRTMDRVLPQLRSEAQALIWRVSNDKDIAV